MAQDSPNTINLEYSTTPEASNSLGPLQPGDQFNLEVSGTVEMNEEGVLVGRVTKVHLPSADVGETAGEGPTTPVSMVLGGKTNLDSAAEATTPSPTTY